MSHNSMGLHGLLKGRLQLKFFQIVGKLQPDYTVSYFKRQYPS
jgi:hypothetical protein